MPNVTLRDVARRAGVSYQTVSRVINNQGPVAEATRQRVLDSIAELDFHPNKVARSLAAHYSQTLALIAFGLDFYGPAQMVINIEHAARTAGYDLIFSNVPTPSARSLQTTLNSIRRWKVDGILMIVPIREMSSDNLARLDEGIPIVQINGQLGAPTPSVIVEQRYGSRLAAQHLIEQGHRCIAEISGPLNWFDAVERHESWETTMREAGLEPRLSIAGDWSAASGYAAAQRLLEQDADFTALVVGNDQMALGVIHALRERGLRIPQDVSLVGFDDIPEAAFFDPSLTTIRQDFSALGRRGIEYLVERIQNPELIVQQQTIYPEFVLRASTAPPSRT
ncbi:MAG TPA: LacI family DNA-binding transcriptional regulator [Phototrophicaceae bacterium]|nr:LacI family DNA-binding transcriptional regulator [Phototrophicaceae bacterium]